LLAIVSDCYWHLLVRVVISSLRNELILLSIVISLERMGMGKIEAVAGKEWNGARD